MCKAKNLGKQRDETLQMLPRLGGPACAVRSVRAPSARALNPCEFRARSAVKLRSVSCEHYPGARDAHGEAHVCIHSPGSARAADPPPCCNLGQNALRLPR